jgi:DNA-binding GntR family transcriptional regulator
MDANLAVIDLKTQELKMMEKMLIGMDQKTGKSELEGYFYFHDQFHQIFIDCSANKVLIEILINLRKHAFWHRLNLMYFRNVYQYSVELHEKIFELFCSRKARQVEKLVGEHIKIHGRLFKFNTRRF